MTKVPYSKQMFFSKSKLTLAIAAQMLIITPAWTAPTGGEIVGGTGSIEQKGTETTIVQKTDRLAIDWQSFDVGKNERVEFVQPGQSAVALNRILSNNGSEILGQIDANGHVILVNPHGVVFGEGAVVNAGGLIASGLQINPDDFMNGDLVFKRIEGTDGTVINAGMINAASGGNVALIGAQVENRGLISARLGSVILASGKEAVLTFDESGLLGVQVDEAILQSELGDKAAITNSGELNAEGGRILLSASTTRDVFSQAVNWGDQKQARSVTYNDDGSFTLGAGGDVVNTGEIIVSGEVAGNIVALGENITNAGKIRADATQGAGGNVELHSNITTIISEEGIVTANAEQGGDIKILGKNVGLFDSSSVDATGENGGGQILVGGDQEGLNAQIRNADFVYINENASINASATKSGDGGYAIVFAEDTARIHGNLSARGGETEGNGGFVETSGKKGFSITASPDVSAVTGVAGHWLIDPHNITIGFGGEGAFNDNNVFESSDDAKIAVATIVGALVDGATVTIKTGDKPPSNEMGNITIAADTHILFAEPGATATLNLIAHNNIIFKNNIKITASKENNSILNLHLNANTSANLDSRGSIWFGTNTSIETAGGDFKIERIERNDLSEDSFGAYDINLTNISIDVGSGDFVAHAANKFTLAQDLNLGGGDLVLGAAVWDFGKSGSPGVASISAGQGDITFSTRGNLRLPNIQSARDIILNVRDAKEGDQLKLHNARQIGDGWRQFALSGTLTLDLGSPGTVEIHEIQKIGENGELKLVVTSDEMDQNQTGSRVDLQTSQGAVLGEINVKGEFSLEANGTIKQEQGGESLNIVGESKFSSSDLDLNNSENFFGDTIFIGDSANTVVLKAKGNLMLARSTEKGHINSLDVAASGHIQQSGALNVTAITLSAEQITLDHEGNNFSSIEIAGYGNEEGATSAKIVDSESLELASVNVQGKLELSGVNTLTQSGALSVGELDLNVDGKTCLSGDENRIGILSGSGHAGKIYVRSPLKVEDFLVGSMRDGEQLELKFVLDGPNSSVGISSIEVGNIELSGNADLVVSNFTEFVLNGEVKGLGSGTKSFFVNGAENEKNSYKIGNNASWQNIAFHIDGRGKGVLQGPDLKNNWGIQIDGPHQLSTDGRMLSFEGIHKIKGGNDTDMLDYTKFSDGAITLGNLPKISAIANIEIVKGNGTQTLVAPDNTSNTWIIGNGRNTITIEPIAETSGKQDNGDVVEPVKVLEFQGFTNLRGGNGVDNSNVDNSNVDNSNVDNSGVDNFIVQLDGQESNGQTPSYRLDGGGKNDSLVVISKADWSGTYGVGQNGDAEFTFSYSGKERIKVSHEGIEDISLNSHLDQMEVKGRVDQDDSISLSANWWQLNDFAQVKYDGGLQRLVIDGGEDDAVYLVHNEVSDTGTVTDPNGAVTPPPPPAVIQIGKSLTLKGDTLSFVEGIQLETESLSLIGFKKGIGTKESPLITSVDALELSYTGGDIFIRELNGIQLNGLSGSDLIDLEVMDGDLSQGGAITKDTGSLQLSAIAGDIHLDNDANEIGAQINLNAAGRASVHTKGDLSLSGVAARDLSLRASGGIESDEPIFVSNETQLVSGGDIRLENSSNDFGSVAITPVNDGVVKDVYLADSNAVTFLDVSISGNFSIVAEEIHFSGMVSAYTLTASGAKNVWVWRPMVIEQDVHFNGSPEVRGVPLIHTKGGEIYGARSLTAGDRMIEIETLAEIDPAIFTNVKNYFYQDISVLLPSDQRYEDSSEEEKFSGLAN
jgi:filamentous hemagglutinin family protein